ncbi:tripartite tricarboxylate transporter TctB family protein [Rhizomonospora bruguierae]|uniref:tripartite tricarboxylate transporter TctB family protein n=1 Tax=Rhizomonospora bruguierae TaxID=1581705 RepID=UPI001BCFFBA3|nr:tripartite tricarboxylate transporter TctB family protein [Micromonospora sp. NBRC 107566]
MVTKAVKLTFDALIVAVFAYAAIEATSFTPGGRWLPLFVAIAGVILAVVNIVLDGIGAVRGARANGAAAQADRERNQEFETDVRSALYWLAWLVGYVVLVIVFGALIASPVWLGLFLRTQAKVGWLATLASVVGTVAVLYLFSRYLPFVLPPGIFE